MNIESIHTLKVHEYDPNFFTQEVYDHLRSEGFKQKNKESIEYFDSNNSQYNAITIKIDKIQIELTIVNNFGRPEPKRFNYHFYDKSKGFGFYYSNMIKQLKKW